MFTHLDNKGNIAMVLVEWMCVGDGLSQTDWSLGLGEAAHLLHIERVFSG